MLERDVEKRLKTKVEQVGGMCIKLAGTNLAGIPDRLVLFPGGKIAFVELKRPGEKPRKLQVHRIKELRKLGFTVFVVDRYEGIEEVLEYGI